MVAIELDRITIDLPVLGHHALSLKRAILSTATGGGLAIKSGVTIVRALSEVTLSLREGDRLGVAGHNGAGKTTLLRVLSGAYPPTVGSRKVTGSIASLIDPSLGMELDATGYENILLRGLVIGHSRQAIARRKQEIAEFSGLGDFLSMPARTFSTGMLMRLAFAITTAFPADILLMDEWLSVGDAAFRDQAEARMRDMVARSGILVLASHSPSLIERECTRCITLEHGRVAKDAPVQSKPTPPPAQSAARPQPSPAT